MELHQTSSQFISLIDVAGGYSGAALSISEASPHVTCSVLDDLPDVAKASTSADVMYNAGDMFET